MSNPSKLTVITLAILNGKFSIVKSQWQTNLGDVIFMCFTDLFIHIPKDNF